MKGAAVRARVVAAAALLAAAIAGAAPAEDFRLLQIDGATVKWDSPRLGAGAAVTWGLAEAGVAPGLRNCRRVGPPGPEAAPVRAAAAAAFALWSAAAGIAFRPAGPGERAEIVIGAQPGMRRAAYADVRPDPRQAAGGVAPLAQATICLDPGADWGGAFDLQTVLAHEIGHAIGLDHPGAVGALMGFENQGALGALLPGDIAGGRALYGPPRLRVAGNPP